MNSDGSWSSHVAVEGESEPNPAHPSPFEKTMSYKGRAFVESMQWLRGSMETLSEKLGEISDDIEKDVDKEEIEQEIKRVFREVFTYRDSAEGSPPMVQGSVVEASMPSPPSEIAPIMTQQPTPAQAEVSSNDTFSQSVAIVEGLPDPPPPPGTPTVLNKTLVVTTDRPILGDGVPDWIRQRVTEEDQILVPIESSMYTTVEECRDDLESKLVGEAKKVLDSYVLRGVSSDSIPELTSSFIRDKLIDQQSEFDNFQERPSGSFHQLWVRMDIDKKELAQIREWERAVVTQERVWRLGGLSFAVLGSIAGLSGVVNLFSRREQYKSQKKQEVA
jgi:hypothetical protein